MSFYVTLPSDSSVSYYPANTTSHFVTRLPLPISLTGEWECALSEIVYSHTWFNVTDKNNLFGFDLGDGKLLGRNVPVGYYATVPDLLNSLKIPALKNKILFNYNENTRKVRITTKDGAKLLLKSGIAELLGFEPMLIDETIESPYVADTNVFYPVLYVYSDIIQPQIVGDVQAPLLRVVRVKGKDNEVISSHYDRPHYLPIARKDFQTIEIEIRDSTGNYIPFSRGKAIFVLHFRTRQLL